MLVKIFWLNYHPPDHTDRPQLFCGHVSSNKQFILCGLICYAVDLYTPKVGIISEDFGADIVTVTVEWAQHVGITMYITRISPLTRPTLSTSTPGLNNSRLLILSYNTSYNLSVVAVTPCGNATAYIELKYGEM